MSEQQDLNRYIFGSAMFNDNDRDEEEEPLTEAQREKILFECKDAKNLDEVRKILRDKFPEGGINDLTE